MKPFLNFSLSIIMLLSFYACSKNDDTPNNPVDQLPLATQTGANTIGCLVNGEALLPGGYSLNGQNFQCFYQRVEGEYYFGLSFFRKKGEIIKSINITLQKIKINEGETYILDNNYTNQPINEWGGGAFNYSERVLDGLTYYLTEGSQIGELKITRFDSINQIISGTFWFDAKEINTGEIIHVTNGRFDMQFIR